MKLIKIDIDNLPTKPVTSVDISYTDKTYFYEGKLSIRSRVRNEHIIGKDGFPEIIEHITRSVIVGDKNSWNEVTHYVSEDPMDIFIDKVKDFFGLIFAIILILIAIFIMVIAFSLPTILQNMDKSRINKKESNTNKQRVTVVRYYANPHDDIVRETVQL